MNQRIAAASVLLVSLCACTSLRAPSRQGLIAMEDHRCVDAIRVMQGPAAAGDGYSINNLGVIIEAGCVEAGWPADPAKAFAYYRDAAERGVPMAFSNAGALLEFGKVSNAPDPDAAAVLYREGARYGDENSTKGLERLHRPVPSVDRVAPDIAERRQAQLDFALLVAGIVVERQTSAPQTRPGPRPQQRSLAPAATLATGGPTCRINTDCTTGKTCVVPAGQISGLGVCAVPTKGGMAVIPPPRLMPATIPSCQFDTQCPTGFKCERVKPEDLNGLCTGPEGARSYFQ
jgi:hypothetical protein